MWGTWWYGAPHECTSGAGPWPHTETGEGPRASEGDDLIPQGFTLKGACWREAEFSMVGAMRGSVVIGATLVWFGCVKLVR